MKAIILKRFLWVSAGLFLYLRGSEEAAAVRTDRITQKKAAQYNVKSRSKKRNRDLDKTVASQHASIKQLQTTLNRYRQQLTFTTFALGKAELEINRLQEKIKVLQDKRSDEFMI